jgi:hypothetical protein
VEDMLDPGFGYVRELPGIERDPAALKLLRERYRVVWDVTVDGRLSRQGLLESGVREARRAEFVRAFSMLGPGAEDAFGQWFEGPRPDHAAIVAFIQEPRGPGGGDPARGVEIYGARSRAPCDQGLRGRAADGARPSGRGPSPR